MYLMDNLGNYVYQDQETDREGSADGHAMANLVLIPTHHVEVTFPCIKLRSTGEVRRTSEQLQRRGKRTFKTIWSPGGRPVLYKRNPDG
jgi:hypothetical protein